MKSPYRKNQRKKGPPPGLINALIFSCMYGYFALNMDGDPNDCYANDTTDDRIDQNTATSTELGKTTNIGAKFGITFKILFFLTLGELCISLFAYSLSHTKEISRDQAKPVY